MADVDPFESMRSLAELGKSGNAFLQSRRAVPRHGDRDARRRGGRSGGAGSGSRHRRFRGGDAFGELWSSSTELSASLAKAMQGGQASIPSSPRCWARSSTWKPWMSGTTTSTRRCRRWPRARGSLTSGNVDKFLAVFNARGAAPRTLEHNTVTLDAWTRAAGAFARMLNGRPARAKSSSPGATCSRSGSRPRTRRLLETQRSDVPEGRSGRGAQGLTDLQARPARLSPNTTARCSAIRRGPSRRRPQDRDRAAPEPRAQRGAAARRRPRRARSASARLSKETAA